MMDKKGTKIYRAVWEKGAKSVQSTLENRFQPESFTINQVQGNHMCTEGAQQVGEGGEISTI